MDAKQKFCTLANSPTCWHKDHISVFQEQVSPRVVQKCICDLSPAVNSGKLETQSQELEVLAKNEDGLNPANCLVFELSNFQKNFTYWRQLSPRATFFFFLPDSLDRQPRRSPRKPPRCCSASRPTQVRQRKYRTKEQT